MRSHTKINVYSFLCYFRLNGEIRPEKEMTMNETEGTNSPWLILAAAYAAALAGAILLGTLISMGGEDAYSGNEVRMPYIATLIALTLGMAAFALYRQANWGRFLFLVCAPWGSIALGGAFAEALWQDDVPYTALVIFAYVPIAFLLSRGSTLWVIGAKDSKWLTRGGALLLVCVAVMFLALMGVYAAKPNDGSFYGLNEYVKWQVLCYVPLWNYVIALIAVSIPTRFDAKEDAKQVTQANAAEWLNH